MSKNLIASLIKKRRYELKMIPVSLTFTNAVTYCFINVSDYRSQYQSLSCIYQIKRVCVRVYTCIHIRVRSLLVYENKSCRVILSNSISI